MAGVVPPSRLARWRPTPVVARPINWTLISARLQALGCPVSEAIAQGAWLCWTRHDAGELPARWAAGRVPFSRNRRNDRQAPFEARRLKCTAKWSTSWPSKAAWTSRTSSRCCGIGWPRKSRFTLLCGYSSAHLATRATRKRSIGCAGATSRVESLQATCSRPWLLNARHSQYHPGNSSKSPIPDPRGCGTRRTVCPPTTRPSCRDFSETFDYSLAIAPLPCRARIACACAASRRERKVCSNRFDDTRATRRPCG